MAASTSIIIVIVTSTITAIEIQIALIWWNVLTYLKQRPYIGLQEYPEQHFWYGWSHGS